MLAVHAGALCFAAPEPRSGQHKYTALPVELTVYRAYLRPLVSLSSTTQLISHSWQALVRYDYLCSAHTLHY